MRLALLSSLSAVLVLGGCANQAQQIGGKPRTGHPPTVVSLSPSATEVLLLNLNTSPLVGRTSADDYPATASKVPVVASVKPDFEAIQKIKPELVVYDADLYNEGDVKRIASMGIPTYAFSARSVIEFERQLYELANKLGNETEVSGYIDRIELARSSALGDKLEPAPKVAVVLGGGGYVAGTTSFVADVVKSAGGVPVGPAADRFVPMSPEAMVAAAPDVIVLATSTAAAAKDVAALKADPRLAATPAMRNGHIIALPADIVTRRGGRVDKFVESLHTRLVLMLQTKA